MRRACSALCVSRAGQNTAPKGFWGPFQAHGGFRASRARREAPRAPRELGKTALPIGAKNLSFSGSAESLLLWFRCSLAFSLLRGLWVGFPKIRNPERVLRFFMHVFDKYGPEQTCAHSAMTRKEIILCRFWKPFS